MDNQKLNNWFDREVISEEKIQLAVSFLGNPGDLSRTDLHRDVAIWYVWALGVGV